MAKDTIQVKKLQKSYGQKQVLKDISFSAQKGQILAVLGPNGAGKTTTVKILSTLLKPDAGNVKVAGYNLATEADKIRGSIGLTGQFAAVDEYLTGKENIVLAGRLYHMSKAEATSRADTLLEQFDLVEAGSKPARTYSGGMKRRLDLAMSLVASPDIIYLDEPTTGLDPRSRLGLWEMVKKLANDGKTILLTTQYMEEADYLADNIIVIDQGTVIAEGTSLELKKRAGADKLEFGFRSSDIAKKAQKIINGTLSQDDTLLSLPAEGSASLREALHVLEKRKIYPETAALRPPTLDDVFLELTGHSATNEEEAK